jgi:hypothetical protein
MLLSSCIRALFPRLQEALIAHFIIFELRVRLIRVFDDV